MGHELRDIRQHFSIRRLLASVMRRAEEDQTQCRILDGLISWMQPCLKQSLKGLSAVKLFFRDLAHRYTCFTTIPPREWAINIKGR